MMKPNPKSLCLFGIFALIAVASYGMASSNLLRTRAAGNLTRQIPVTNSNELEFGDLSDHSFAKTGAIVDDPDHVVVSSRSEFPKNYHGRINPPNVFGQYQNQYRDPSPQEIIEWYRERNGLGKWEVDPKFQNDVFTFVRVKYSSGYGNRNYYGRRRGWGGKWDVDYPDSDWNFSFRLQQLTTLKVDPTPIYLELTDPKLYNYPFLYMIEPGRLEFKEEEVKNLRRYLENGGFLMVDDFWGEEEWENFYFEIKRVFPDREPFEVDIEHPIFNTVYQLKEKPQVPAAGIWMQTGRSYDRPGCEEVHYKAITDDNGRIMVFICHNTDLGDGWEREGESREYFELFSEAKAYPMGINIVVYAMTH